MSTQTRIDALKERIETIKAMRSNEEHIYYLYKDEPLPDYINEATCLIYELPYTKEECGGADLYNMTESLADIVKCSGSNLI